MLTLRELPEYGLDPLARLGCRLAVKVRAGHDVQLLEQPLARGGQVIYYTSRWSNAFGGRIRMGISSMSGDDFDAPARWRIVVQEG